MNISLYAHGSALGAALLFLSSCAQPARAPQASSTVSRRGEGEPARGSLHVPGAIVGANPTAHATVNEESEVVGEHKPDTGITLTIETSALSADRIEYSVHAVARHLVPSATLSVTVASGAVLVGPSSWVLTNLAPDHSITHMVTVQRTSAVPTNGAHVIAAVQITRPGETVSEAIGEWVFGAPSRERQTSIGPRTALTDAVEHPTAPVGTERLIRTPNGETLHDTIVR